MADAENRALLIFRRLAALATVSAMLCAALVFAWVSWLPLPAPEGTTRFDLLNLVLLVAFFVVAVPIAMRRTWRLYRPIARVYAEQRLPTPEEQLLLLRQPILHAVHNLGHWVAAAVLFTAVTVVSGGTRLLSVRLATAILLGGLSSSAVVYLLVEAGHRPLVADFLQGRSVPRPVVLGVTQRLLVSWMLGSGVCLLAVLTAPLDLGGSDLADAVPVMVAAAALGVVGGAALVWVTARSVASRLRLVSVALRRVERGDLDVSVPVDDGGEVGQLQGSLNHMVSGLRELTAANAQLTGEVQAQLAEVRASRTRIVTAADEARRNVERDLHDGAQQRLVALGLSLRMAHNRAKERSQADLMELIDGAHGELQVALRELRELAAGLHPTLLTEAGLAAAVTDAAARCPVSTTITELPDAPLPATLEAAAYYTVAEGLTNAVKHARADHIRVSVMVEGTELVVGVADDGVGGAAVGGGSGLVGLHDRVSSFGGTLRVHSPAGHGTALWATFTIPGDGPDTGRAVLEPPVRTAES